MMEPATPDEQAPRRPGRPRKHPEEPRKPKMIGHTAAGGKMLPACPMTPEELADQWNVGADDVETITVKVLRARTGTADTDLVASVPLVEFDGRKIAGQFGPGTYYLRPAAGRYARNSAKLPVSDYLARECGFGRIPTTAADLHAERTIRSATTGPVDPVDLVAAIEAIMDRKEREKAAQSGHTLASPIVQAVDPLEMMRKQFENIQTMMAFMGSLEERAIKTVEMRMGKVEPVLTGEDTNSSLLEKLLPKALDIFGNMMANRNQPQPVMYAQPQQPQQPQTPTLAAKPTQPEPEAPAMPELTPQEQAAISTAVRSLQPFAATLVQLASSGATDEQIVDELDPWIPGGMVPSLQALAATVEAKGHSVLGAIHPQLATERWAKILPLLVARCSA